MPQFPARLKRDLDFECLETDVEMCTPKRRRIERIAEQCLKGRRPLIITASLVGPFDKGWKNPWAKITENNDTARTRSHETQRTLASALSQPPSPETARGLEETSLSVSEHNPFWLSRDSEKGECFDSSGGSQPEPSPSRSRNEDQPFKSDDGSPLAPPEVAHVPMRCSPGPEQAPDNAWKSSASASMMLTSPTTAVPVGRCCTPVRTTLAEAPSTIVVPNTTSGALQCAQTREDATNTTQTSLETTPIVPATCTKSIASPPPPCFTPINPSGHEPGMTISRSIHFDDASPPIREGHSESTGLALRAIVDSCNSSSSRRGPSHDDVERSAEKCAGPRSSTRKKKKKATDAPAHELVASPALGSSTGFAFRYKRAINARSKKEERRSKAYPDADSFRTSPAMEIEPAHRDTDDVSTNSPSSLSSQQVSPVGKESYLSTQAAIMRAHLEFQEDSVVEGDVTPRPSLPSPVETPPEMNEPSISFTPFSTFNAELERQHPPEQALPEEPISTQDLFAAVSPFAFSTAKKNNSKLMGSNLRFSVYPSEEERARLDAEREPKSPTPLDRIPLKDKNSQGLAVSTESEKGSQDSIKSAARVQHRPPRLDLGGSLGVNSDVGLADCTVGNDLD